MFVSLGFLVREKGFGCENLLSNNEIRNGKFTSLPLVVILVFVCEIEFNGAEST